MLNYDPSKKIWSINSSMICRAFAVSLAHDWRYVQGGDDCYNIHSGILRSMFSYRFWEHDFPFSTSVAVLALSVALCGQGVWVSLAMCKAKCILLNVTHLLFVSFCVVVLGLGQRYCDVSWGSEVRRRGHLSDVTRPLLFTHWAAWWVNWRP